MPVIDRDNLRQQLRHQYAGAIYELLDRAVDELTDEQLRRVIADHIKPKNREGDHEMTGNPFSLAAIERFGSEARAGRYYEDFDVNSKNCTQQSPGTIAFHAEFSRHLRACLAAPRAGTEHALCAAFDVLFGLMFAIDACRDDIVFYADEGGSWQLGVQWPPVFTAWCPCLAATSGAEQYAERVARVVGELLYECDRPKAMEIARAAAHDEQRAALDQKIGGARRR